MSTSVVISHHMVLEPRLLKSSFQDDPMGGIFNPNLPPIFDVYDDEVPSSLGRFCLFSQAIPLQCINEPGGTSLFHNGFTKEKNLAVNFDLPLIFDGTINCNDAASETRWTALENLGVNSKPVCFFGSACYCVHWKAMVNDTFHFHGFEDA
ncbi:hypothetical protein RND81_06G078100 [Saponaria officinalis]|uniref:Uncharacterized protein n=1 Tax=Saponaria officinalis TaxID=3572 RepID=A0AAW1K7X1_SAPOF